MSEITVFISYSHDSDAHRERVLAISERLRKDGIDTVLDQYVNGAPPQGWPRWMLDQLDAAAFVLVICTATYYRRFRGHEVPGQGKGVDWEGALITQEIYDQRSTTLKFVPALLSADADGFIPEPLRSLTRYALTAEAAYQSLYDFLLGQAGAEAGPVGSLKTKAKRKAAPLTFGDEPAKRPAEADISRFIKYAPAELVGREAETKILGDAWEQAVSGETKRPHVLTVVALGGEGKTSLVAKWAAELAHRDWPGCEAAYAWSFYSQGTREQLAASSDLFLAAALTFFGDPEMAGSAQGAFDKGRRLAQLVGQRRALLVLDGLEPLQFAPTAPTPGELKDQGLAALLKGLAGSSRGLCVVTTRYSIQDLKAFWQTTAPEHVLKRLSLAAGVALLRKLGVQGSERPGASRRSEPTRDPRLAPGGSQALNEFEQLVEDVRGHALTLNLLGSYLHDAHAGDIRKRDLVKLAEADAEEQGGHAFRVMDAYAQSLEREGAKGQRALAVLRLLGLFDRPATGDCLAALLEPPAIKGLTEVLVGMSEAQRNVVFTRLATAKLLTVNRDAAGTLVSLDAHPLIREYFAKQLRGIGFQPVIDPGNDRLEAYPTWRAAHRRLYEHLCASTKDKPDATLEDLQPLYQAVAHGCQAGLQQEAHAEVFYARIRRRQEAYSLKKLGAFGSDLGAVACFFETPWSRVSPAFSEANQAWYLNEAGFTLRALGRLTEALEPMRAGLEMRIKQEVWNSAARIAGNLSQLELTLGEVAGAVGEAERSVTYADRSGDAFSRMCNRTTHADALHQAGRRAEAEARFREAEQMQAERQPAYPLLYSLQGFRYCDLLLADAERAAWRITLECGGSTPLFDVAERLSFATPLSPGTANAVVVELQEAKESGSAAGQSGVEPPHSKACHAVAQRATQTLKWSTNLFNHGLLTIALDHLTLGRAALYAAILQESPLSNLKSEIEQAVSGLRRAGEQDPLVLGLLTRAWLRFLTAARTGPDSAQSDLDEAWEIAQRGPMPLFLADIRLSRVRLFGGTRDEGERIKEKDEGMEDEQKYPWESPEADLAEARRLIEKHSYGRRKEELEEAERAILG